MAQPTTLRATKLLIQLGDGASPEVFAAPCAITAKGINFTANTQDDEIADCDDPDAPIWVARGISSLSAGITGSGTLALKHGSDFPFEDWRDWFLSGDPRNIRVKFDVTGANGGGYYEMSAVLTTFNQTGEGKGLVQLELGIASAGVVEWEDAA
jgi:hypothetical protein